MSDIPPGTLTLLECRTCKQQKFKVSWNWNPGQWTLECLHCHAFWALPPDGIPNPQEIHGAKIDLPGVQRDSPDR